MASEQMRVFLEGIKNKPKKHDGRMIEEQRVWLDDFMSYQKAPVNVDIVDFEIANRQARSYLPKGARTDRGVLYLHGGGYVVGSLDAYHSLMAHLSVACNAEVTGLDYRLAPEHPYPAALEDAVAAFEEMTRSITANHIMIAGDSAGGGLTLACLLTLKERGLPLPGCATLISPWTDLTCSGASLEGEGETYIKAASPYIGDYPPETVGISPLFGDLDGLPPLLIQVASDEALLDDSIRLEKRAIKAGVSVDIRVFEEAFHVFQMFTEFPETQDALSDVSTFFNLHIQQCGRSKVPL